MNKSPKSRRYLTFSLRTLFVVTTALAVWLGVVVNRAREQREAVRAIEALGGAVVYDFQLDRESDDSYVIKHDNEPRGPLWLRRIIGDECFQNVEIVFLWQCTDGNIQESIRHLQQLRCLSELYFIHSDWKKAQRQFADALPGWQVIAIRSQ